MKELQEMRRQQASSIVIPDAGAASALGRAPAARRGARSSSPDRRRPEAGSGCPRIGRYSVLRCTNIVQVIDS